MTQIECIASKEMKSNGKTDFVDIRVDYDSPLGLNCDGLFKSEQKSERGLLVDGGTNGERTAVEAHDLAR